MLDEMMDSSLYSNHSAWEGVVSPRHERLSPSSVDSRITPPNSNSNTTISCGSGNSTSANLGLILHDHNNRGYKCQAPKLPKKCALEEGYLEDGSTPNNVDLENNASKRKSWVVQQEFLPICDALFNMISLMAYFCTTAFHILSAYAWYQLSQESSEDYNGESSGGELERMNPGLWVWSLVALSFILLSILLCQGLSLRWYLLSRRRGQMGPNNEYLEGPPQPCGTIPLILLHIFGCGVIWRYFKLFIPVDIRFVKNEVRDLALLRMVHAFAESAPILLIQLYLVWTRTSNYGEVSDLTRVSVSLSLFSICWGLASFSKNVRKENVHKLVLTWLGVIFQLFWHLGTVTSRVVALSIYASLYVWWVCLVLLLHWIVSLLWLLSPNHLFSGEKMQKGRKIVISSLLAVVYTFCYVNVKESRSRWTVAIYYVTMGLENSLLLSVWLLAKRYEDFVWYRETVTMLVFVPFFLGLCFMGLYYRFFHIRRLTYAQDNVSIYHNSSVISGGGGTLGRKRKEKMSKRSNDETSEVPHSIVVTPPQRFQKKLPNGQSHTIPLPTNAGVFNCRFGQPGMKRKKKKPSTFVPLPSVSVLTVTPPSNPNSVNPHSPHPKEGCDENGRMVHPFWKRPLSISLSEAESNSSRQIDIQQKLQEKKEEQLKVLRVIEEEIKAGKLQRPDQDDDLVITPIPFIPTGRKRHVRDPNANEVILSPSDYIYDDCCIYDNDIDGMPYYHSIYTNFSDQESLPRSQTLPVLLRANKKGKQRKVSRSEHVVPSTNSSDGDVSGEEDPEVYGPLGGPFPLPLPSSAPQPGRMRSQPRRLNRSPHETKL